MFETGSKYRRVITQNLPGLGVPVGTSIIIDVYDAIDCFDVKDPGVQHALKKLLCTGIRGPKDAATDIREAIDALHRALNRLALTDKESTDAAVESKPGPSSVQVGPSHLPYYTGIMVGGGTRTRRQSKTKGAKVKKDTGQNRSNLVGQSRTKLHKTRAD